MLEMAKLRIVNASSDELMTSVLMHGAEGA